MRKDIWINKYCVTEWLSSVNWIKRLLAFLWVRFWNWDWSDTGPLTLLIFIFIRQKKKRRRRRRRRGPTQLHDWSAAPSGPGNTASSEEREERRAIQSNITTLFTPRCLHQDFTNNQLHRKPSDLTSRHIYSDQRYFIINILASPTRHPCHVNSSYIWLYLTPVNLQ